MPENKPHRQRSIFRRALFSVAVIVVVLAIGTIGFHFISGYHYVYSFFFTVMLATGEGPASTPATAAGQLFASFMAFLGVGTVVVSLIYLFGPALIKFFRMGEEDFRKEERSFRKRVRTYEKEI